MTHSASKRFQHIDRTRLAGPSIWNSCSGRKAHHLWLNQPFKIFVSHLDRLGVRTGIEGDIFPFRQFSRPVSLHALDTRERCASSKPAIGGPGSPSLVTCAPE